MAVTESRNMSLESLRHRHGREAIQASTGSARGKACGQAVASRPLHVAEPVLLQKVGLTLASC